MLSNNVSQSNISLGQPTASSVGSTPGSSTTSTLHSSSSANSTAGLEKGQVVRGDIVDLRSNEVSVKLEDGRVLTGKLDESNNLAIGERVAFRVEEVSLKSLTLKIIPDSHVVIQDSTIDKALDAAGLGKSTRNRGIVSELLNQQMPIDKKTVSLLIQQSITHKASSIQTLVFMNKYHIPVTESNINQLEAYSNSEHSMMSKISDLANEIPNLFAELSSSSNVSSSSNLSSSSNPQFLSQSNDLLNLILTTSKDIPTLSGSSQVGTDLNGTATVITVGSLLSPEESLTFVQSLEANPASKLIFSQELLHGIMDGSADIRDVAPLLNQLQNASIDSQHDASSSNLLPNSFVQNSLVQNSFVENLSPSQTILSEYQNMQFTNNELGAFLPLADRMNLIKSLDSFSISPELKGQIQSGEISTPDLLRLIQSKLNSTPEASIRDLFSSKEYKSLIKEELLSKWTFTPNSLVKEGAVDHYFQNLSHELSEVKEFISQNFGGTKENLSGQTSNLQENINFMKTLNELFTYMQLPIKFQEQNANSELYVYSRKKTGRTADDGISVLLHLDMDHLGPLDIHIDLHHNNIVGKFYLNDPDVIDMIATQMPNLEQALVNKGFTLNAEVLKREKDVNMVEDFIKQDAPKPSVTRYNFDIRA